MQAEVELAASQLETEFTRLRAYKGPTSLLEEIIAQIPDAPHEARHAPERLATHGTSYWWHKLLSFKTTRLRRQLGLQLAASAGVVRRDVVPCV